jgi:hypothetical protein
MLRLFVLLLSCLLLPSAFAETTIGPLLGVNIGSLTTDDDAVDLGSNTGLLTGGFAEFGLSDELFFEAQLRYAEKGAKVDDAAGEIPGSTDVYLNLDYIELPLYLKYKFLAGSGFRPYLFGGFTPSILVEDSISARDRTTGQSVTLAGAVSNATGVELNSFDLSADLGLGAEIAFTDSVNLRLSGSYSLGLLEVFDTAEATVKHRGIQLYGALGFVL